MQRMLLPVLMFAVVVVVVGITRLVQWLCGWL